MNIHIGTDHAGFELKEKLVQYLNKLGHEITDHGAFSYDLDDDYPDFITPVAHAVSMDMNSLGIILGGSGQGEAMCANKISGIRAGVFYGCVIPDLIRYPGFNDKNLNTDLEIETIHTENSFEIVRLLREHNNANILSLGARFITDDEVFAAVKVFLETEFSNDERHVRRINKF